MWTKQMDDGMFIITSSFHFRGKMYDSSSADLSPTPSGFAWVSDQTELDRMAAENERIALEAEIGNI